MSWIERETVAFKNALTDAHERIADLEARLADMRAALEWYARCDIAAKAVSEGTYCRMEHDDGERARAALACASGSGTKGE